MDKKIKKKTWTLQRILITAFGGAFILFILYAFIFADRRSKVNVDSNKITISTVERGVFQERIPQTGTVEPARTVYLDAIEGGTIKRIELESGALVKPGDVIMELSNLNRELSVLSQEANLNESINRVRQTRLQLTQNDLSQQQQLALIENQLSKLRPQYEREKELYEKQLIARQVFEKTEADYHYNLKRKEITYKTYKNDSIARVRQLRQLDDSERKMLKSLDGVGQILDNLVIRSPIQGQLSTPRLEIGQAVTPGQRLGQVDIVGEYKVRAGIDEIYLPRISTGLKATTPFNNQEWNLVITYIYPDIMSGRFNVDLEFDGPTPDGIKRGQSLRLRIQLGNSSEELLLPVGGFYKDTGGNWVYVVDEGTGKAVRRDIRLGRKNPDNFEVLDGLEEGDRVITSSYDHFGDNEVLVLKNFE